jgi:photosystem II stability/assembly factor-like uncharacterized protein
MAKKATKRGGASAKAAKAPAKTKGKTKRPRGARVTLVVATMKGAFTYRSDAARREWKLERQHHFGCVVNHVVADPRDGTTWLAAVRTGHLGPTVFRSADRGKTWKEATTPPAFPKVPEGEKGRKVTATFWLTPGHTNRPGEWWAGTSPHGLFRSKDGGATWEEVKGFAEGLRMWSSVPGRVEEVPGGSITHSVLVDPRDGAHLFVGLSVGGVFESRDDGATWKPLNLGVVAEWLPEKDPEWGHDPHCIAIHPAKPDVLWQQNHCGMYRIERPAERWERVGNAMPKAVGDVGFPMVLHPHDPDTAYVVPMDGTSVWPRTSVDGKPAVYRTGDAGKSWQRLDAGFPAPAWWTVKRQAACADAADPAGLYLGTTSGEVWASRDEGRRFARVASHLPHVLAVTAITEG